MNSHKSHTSEQQGYTLLELLIGMTLSLIIIAAATQAYSTSKQTWNAMTAAQAVHANARVAMRNIREHVQMAGGAYLQSTGSSENNWSVTLSAAEEPSQAVLSGVNGTKYVESLTLGHWHAFDPIDCQGNTSSTHTNIRNSYKLNTNKELSCKDLNLSNSTYQALAEGVEDFQLRYAEVTPNAQTVQWKTANQVIDMQQVAAIEVCIRVASVNTVHHTKPQPNALGCQGEAPPFDGKARRTFKRVFALRNRDNLIP